MNYCGTHEVSNYTHPTLKSDYGNSLKEESEKEDYSKYKWW